MKTAMVMAMIATGAMPSHAEMAGRAGLSTSMTAADPTPAAQALAHDIAKLLNNEALTLRQTRRALDVSLPKALATNPDIQALEKEYPGVTVAVIAAMRPEIERNTLSRLPVAWQRLGAIYADTFSDAELRTLLAFYRSPTGLWLLESIAEGTDLTAALSRRVGANDDIPLTAQELRDGITKPGVALAMKTATPAQRVEIMKFGLSPIGRKLSAINPRIAETAAALSNERQPGAQERVEQAAANAARDFISRADAAKKKPGS